MLHFLLVKVMQKKVILIILDGWGETQDPKVSALEQGKTPFFDSLIKNYPNASLRTDGLHVGLPEGQMGNSEVGHMNLGAGRIVFQDFVKINNAIENESIAKEKALVDAFKYGLLPAKPMSLSSVSAGQNLLKCSSVSVPRGYATCSKARAKSRHPLSLSTRSTRSAARAVPVSVAGMMNANRH